MPAHHSLPLLRERTDELSKCAYCPKLCRATCVVSEQLPREALLPWGKMTAAFGAEQAGRADPQQAELAWGCTNCFRCREACDHRNPVSETLNDARADYVALGLAPRAVAQLLERRGAIELADRAAVGRLAHERGVDRRSNTALLLGCRYARVLPEEARSAIGLASRLSGSVRLLRGCCGAWQRSAGDVAAADAARGALRRELGPSSRLLVLEPRCALELAELAPLTLVELAARHEERFGLAGDGGGQFRYHDSCALGRGLGLYDEPRRLLARITGSPVLELQERREQARCSGAGGLLPVTMPEVAQGAAESLAREHRNLGAGTLVTSCASSSSLLRRTGVQVVDLITVLAKGLGHG